MRPDWDEYFLKLAELASSRATCPRANVGSVIVKDRRVLATGYNGSPPGAKHCNDGGCLMINGHCQSSVHSEASAIFSAAKYGISLNDATCYVSHLPCFYCFKALCSAGIVRIVYSKPYLNGITRDIYNAMTDTNAPDIQDSQGQLLRCSNARFENDVLVGFDSA